MSDYICILTDEVLASIGMPPSCVNCDDSSWFYRDEQPILNDKGVKFCSVGCADEYDTRVELERTRPKRSDCCPTCGFDNFEHDVDCRNESQWQVDDVAPSYEEER